MFEHCAEQGWVTDGVIAQSEAQAAALWRRQLLFGRLFALYLASYGVFRFFTDSARWASWWGAGSTIDAKPGGRLLICYPGGTEVSGEVVELQPPQRIVFTYGYVSGQMIPPGGSGVSFV